jgi:hypothetical protein
VTNHSKPFFSFLFALLSKFTGLCRDLYYVFTTVASAPVAILCKTHERYLDTVEVWGSSPHGPTIVFNHLAKIIRKLHL